MAGNRIERRSAARLDRPRAAGAVRPGSVVGFDASERAQRPERPANSLDRYSLALQLIQVFPLVSGVTLALVTVTWLARTMAAVVLVTGTVWVIWQDKSRRAERQSEEVRRTPAPRVVVVARPDEYRVSSVRVGSTTPAAFRRRYRRRRLREVRSRPASARPELPRPDRVISKRNPAPSRNDSRDY